MAATMQLPFCKSLHQLPVFATTNSWSELPSLSCQRTNIDLSDAVVENTRISSCQGASLTSCNVVCSRDQISSESG